MPLSSFICASIAMSSFRRPLHLSVAYGSNFSRSLVLKHSTAKSANFCGSSVKSVSCFSTTFSTNTESFAQHHFRGCFLMARKPTRAVPKGNTPTLLNLSCFFIFNAYKLPNSACFYQISLFIRERLEACCHAPCRSGRCKSLPYVRRFPSSAGLCKYSFFHYL